MAQQIFSVTENIYCLKLLFLRPNQHLFEFSSNINNRIKYAICLKLTIDRSNRCRSGASITNFEYI